MCSPRDKERFFLRILLTQIYEATSYENIRTINGILYDTFEEAVRQLGLIDDDDDEFDKCLKEAVTFKMPTQLRRLFASILLFCDPREFDAKKLYNNYKNDLCEDYTRKLQNDKNVQELSEEDQIIAETRALIDIEKYLSSYEKSLTDYSFSPINYSLLEEEYIQNDLIMEELNYDNDDLNLILANSDLLNTDQMNIYNTIVGTINTSADEENIQKVFFIDGPGGYGKTFLFNMILAKVRRDHGIALAVASSGIAALLLDGGRTAHSRFKIPLKLSETSTLNISKQSKLGQLINQARLII